MSPPYNAERSYGAATAGLEGFQEHSISLLAMEWNGNKVVATVLGIVWEWNHALLAGREWE